MYRAIIVEDELLVRVAYQSIVDWESYGFELVGMFENGQAALEAFDELQPDFVLTDTQMPLCNGIELIRQIKAKAPETICVILSAYGDLDYVKDGIRVGADDYLLKLDITADTLGQLLSSTAQKLSKLKRSVVEDVSDELQRGRERFLRSWIRGKYTHQDTVEDYLRFYKIKLNRQRLLCMDIHIAASANGGLLEPEMRATIKRTVAQTLQSTGTWLLVDAGGRDLCAIGCCGEVVLEQYGDNLCRSVLFSLKSVLNLSEVSAKWEVANDLISVSAVFGRLLGLELDACADEYDESSALAEKAVSSLFRLHYEDAVKALQQMRRFFFHAAGISVSTMRNSCAYLLMSLQFSAEKDPLLERLMEGANLKAALSQCTSVGDLGRWIDSLCDMLEKPGQRKGTTSWVSDRAAAYIQQHYSEEISLDEIAAYCGISSAYLSRIFAKEQGRGIQEYLTALRLQNAKQLLATTDQKIYEIAVQSGYPDAVYFNKVFKKNTGMTPKEYRVLHMTIEDKK